MAGYYINFDDEKLKEKQQSVIDWAYKMSKINEFWKGELQCLLNCGGQKISIKMREGHIVHGVLTGVHSDFIQLNNSIRIFFDDILALGIGSQKNDKIFKDNQEDKKILKKE